MRIGIVSDIHCNVRGLQRALEDMGPVDEVLCAGDTLYQYRFSNEVLHIIREMGIRMVLGNHESVILSRDGEQVRNSGTVLAENLELLKRTPTILRMSLDGKRVFLAHGSPWDPLHEYIYPTSDKFHRLAQIDADIIILGHTHIPMVRRVGRVLVVNPGSCGEARDPTYHFQLTYALLDTKTEEAEIRTIEDPDQTRVMELVPQAEPWQPRGEEPAGWEERD